jgi:hypothetical protein
MTVHAHPCGRAGTGATRLAGPLHAHVPPAAPRIGAHAMSRGLPRHHPLSMRGAASQTPPPMQGDSRAPRKASTRSSAGPPPRLLAPLSLPLQLLPGRARYAAAPPPPRVLACISGGSCMHAGASWLPPLDPRDTDKRAAPAMPMRMPAWSMLPPLQGAASQDRRSSTTGTCARGTAQGGAAAAAAAVRTAVAASTTVSEPALASSRRHATASAPPLLAPAPLLSLPLPADNRARQVIPPSRHSSSSSMLQLNGPGSHVDSAMRPLPLHPGSQQASVPGTGNGSARRLASVSADSPPQGLRVRSCMESKLWLFPT